ncbi:MAG: serine hydroxymethyltransferase [Candidatus Ratteibacteria bacterium]|nr:serine hydroxymethyltransferase [Candidatus Ratteibacteria bacterium]
MNNEDIKKADAEVWDWINKEQIREQETINLIASENFASLPVLAAQGSVLTNKYAEGYSFARYYGGCQFIDRIEKIAIERTKELFNCEHANVQPHSGSQANMSVYFAYLKVGDTILGMDLRAGGHLTHGSPVSFSGKFYKAYSYGVDPKNEMIDFNIVEDLAKKYRPKLIVCGYSAYSRQVDFKAFSEIASKVGAYLLADIAHIAGFVAAGLHPSPHPFTDFTTTTTHKTLRGPRGGIVMCRKKFAKKIDSTVFPGIQGGPLMHVIAAKAIALKLASTNEFKDYQKKVLSNAKLMASLLEKLGYRIVSRGTDTHIVLVDLQPQGINGKEAEEILKKVNICVNKNTIPFDPLPANLTSGIRLGTPSVTTQGMGEKEIGLIVSFIHSALTNRSDDKKLASIREEVKNLCRQFPPY